MCSSLLNGDVQGNWGYDPLELVGILRNSSSRIRISSESVAGSEVLDDPSLKNELVETVNFIKVPEKIQIIEGKHCKLTLDYLQTLFEETVLQYQTLWEKEPKRSETEMFVRTYREYCIDSMTREWNWLMEIWEKKRKIKAEDVLVVHEKLTDLGKMVEGRAKGLKVAQEWNVLYCNEDGYREKEIRFDYCCWNTEISLVQKHIAIGHLKFGKIFVPKVCNVRIPCGDSEYFSDLEIGLDAHGEPMAVKHVKSNVSIATLASAVAAMRHLRHRHILQSYLSPGPHCVLATPLMNFNLGQLVMYLSSHGILPQRSFTIVYEMMDGLFFLQTRNNPIIHGNLKPTNILVDNFGSIKIADFRLNLDTLKSPVSSLIWKSPEQVRCYQQGLNCSPATLSADIASAGMLIHFILSGGRHPCGETVEEILYNLAVGNAEICIRDPVARNLMSKMMATSEERINIHDISRHIYWWPAGERWDLVAAVADPENSPHYSSYTLHQYLALTSQQYLAQQDEAILYSKGGIQETKQNISEFLWLTQNFPVSLQHIKQRLPDLPLHLHQILYNSPWAKCNQLQFFFDTNYFQI